MKRNIQMKKHRDPKAIARRAAKARGFIIPKREAITRGLGRYFLGTPCRRGHIDERYTASGLCCSCQAELHATPEYHKATAKAARERRAAAKAAAEAPRGFSGP
jgi:hypothetical protein